MKNVQNRPEKAEFMVGVQNGFPGNIDKIHLRLMPPNSTKNFS
jgi:hypothetical protein